MSVRRLIKGSIISRTYWVWLIVVVLAFSAPSRPQAIFDGLPISSRAEFIFVAIVILTIFGAKERWEGAKTWRILLLALPLVSLGSKAAVSFSSESSAFSACYITDSTPKDSFCETSFADVLAPQTRSRWDQEIHFDAPDRGALRDENAPWKLDFLTLDERQFDATWTGDIDISADQTLIIESSAPIQISLDRAESLRAEDGSFRFKGPFEGPFSLSFLGRESPLEVAPQISVEVTEGSNKTPLRVSSSSIGSASRIVSDIALIFLGASLVIMQYFTRRLRLLVLLPVIAATLIPASIAGSIPAIGPVGNGMTLLAGAASALILSGITFKRAAVFRSGAVLALSSVTLSSISLAGGWGESILRRQGDDWTSYQQFAREMLATGSLRAGEDVFYFQPGYRYILFVSRLVLGPADLPQGLLISAPLVALALWLGWKVIALSLPRRHSLAAALAISSLTLMASSDYLIRHAILGLSEPMAWLVLLLMLSLWARLQLSRPNNYLLILFTIGIFAGLATAVRPNYGLALLSFLFVAATGKSAPELLATLRRSVSLLAGFAIPVLLVLAHNVWFGDSWTVVPSGAGTVYDFRPSRLISVFSNASDRSDLLAKIQGIIGFQRETNGLSSLLGATVILAMYLSWLMTIWPVRKKMKWRSLGLLLWPWMFLPAMVLFDIWIYYPRHVIGLPLSLAASVAIWVLFVSEKGDLRYSSPE